MQQVNKYPWEYDTTIEHLKARLTEYGTLLQTLGEHSTQEADHLQGINLLHRDYYRFFQYSLL